MENQTQNYEQANVYIETVAHLYNMSDSYKQKMYDGAELIQQELEKYDPYDVKVAINKHYKYKSSKEKPNLHQIVAELTGVEEKGNYSSANVENQKYESYDALVNDALEKYFNSQTRVNTLTQCGYTDTKPPKVSKDYGFYSFANINLCCANKIDLFMSQYIQIQANILARTNVCVGLDCDFSRIKPTTHQQSAKYSCLLYYLRSKDFADTVRNRKTISIEIPSDISENFQYKA